MGDSVYVEVDINAKKPVHIRFPAMPRIGEVIEVAVNGEKMTVEVLRVVWIAPEPALRVCDGIATRRPRAHASIFTRPVNESRCSGHTHFVPCEHFPGVGHLSETKG